MQCWCYRRHYFRCALFRFPHCFSCGTKLPQSSPSRILIHIQFLLQRNKTLWYRLQRGYKVQSQFDAGTPPNGSVTPLPFSAPPPPMRSKSYLLQRDDDDDFEAEPLNRAVTVESHLTASTLVADPGSSRRPHSSLKVRPTAPFQSFSYTYRDWFRIPGSTASFQMGVRNARVVDNAPLAHTIYTYATFSIQPAFHPLPTDSTSPSLASGGVAILRSACRGGGRAGRDS